MLFQKSGCRSMFQRPPLSTHPLDPQLAHEYRNQFYATLCQIIFWEIGFKSQKTTHVSLCIQNNLMRHTEAPVWYLYMHYHHEHRFGPVGLLQDDSQVEANHTTWSILTAKTSCVLLYRKKDFTAQYFADPFNRYLKLYHHITVMSNPFILGHV